MKILQICNYQDPFFGGVGQIAQDYGQIFKELGHDQVILCFNENAKLGDWECHRNETVKEEVYGIPVIRCSCVTKIASQSISLSLPKVMRKLMDEFQPNLVLFHYPNPYMAHFFLKYRKRSFILFVIWHSDIIKQKLLGKLFHRQNLRLINRSDKIIGATEKHVNEFTYAKEFADKKYVLPFMINAEKLQLNPDAKKLSAEIREKYKDKTLSLFVGRIAEYKGLRYLIDASKYLDDTNLHFVIAGDGPLLSELKTMAAGDGKIEFLGKITDTERLAYLDACDIFCFPSITRNEAFGLALAEGLYFGKPAVTFTIKASGVNCVNIANVTGLECPNSDAKAYADALRKLVEDENLRKQLGTNARNHVTNDYSKAAFKANVEKLLKEV